MGAIISASIDRCSMSDTKPCIIKNEEDDNDHAFDIGPEREKGASRVLAPLARLASTYD